MFSVILYNLLLLIFSPILMLVLLWRLITTQKSAEGFFERLGFIPGRKLKDQSPRVWLHAVSVGETAAAKPIWEALLAVLPDWQLFHSTTTTTGQEQAVKVVGDHGQVIYLPFDFLPCIWLAFKRLRPSVLLLVETELWPNLLAVARWQGVKVVLVNGRISDRSMRGGERVGSLYRWMTARVDLFCMQSNEDAERIIRLGADSDHVIVTGNSKFDPVVSEVPIGEQVTLRNAMKIARDEQVLLAGSTHPGEEEIVLRAFRQIKALHPRMRLIIAPRHIHRAQEVEELAIAHGFAVARRTRLANMPPPPDAVIILDTIGELARAYALCTVAFVGGSFVPIGGHNILEPLALGKPTIFGPQMSNFRDITAIALDAGVGMQVTSDTEMVAQCQRLLSNMRLRKDISEKTRLVFLQHRGAAERCARSIVLLIHHDASPDQASPVGAAS